MKIHRVLLPALVAIAVWGCSDDGNREVQPQSATPSTALENPDELLPRPFTADEIRKEMVPGFELTVQRVTPEGQRWRPSPFFCC